MRFLRLPLLLAVGAAGLTVGSGPTATAAPLGSIKPCATFTGPKWVDPISPTFHGTKYGVFVNHYNCRTAVSYVRKLVTHKVFKMNGLPVGVSGGPRGWRCTANPSKTERAYRGQCSPLYKFSPNFSWTGSTS